MRLTGLEGKAALVTGAGRARGIGREIAGVLSAAGCRVLVTGRGHASPRGLLADEVSSGWRGVQSVADELRSAGGQVETFEGDLRDISEVDRLASVAESAFGGCDFVINNASANRGEDRASVIDLDWANWCEVTRTNLDTTFLVSKLLCPRLVKAANGGAIVNISSIAAKMFPTETAAYAASKSGVQALTKVMARELGPVGIRVNAVCPGLIDTARMDDLRGQVGWASLVESTPLRRAGAPADVANLVAFLCSDQGGWITGQAINVDGGLVVEA